MSSVSTVLSSIQNLSQSFSELAQQGVAPSTVSQGVGQFSSVMAQIQSEMSQILFGDVPSQAAVNSTQTSPVSSTQTSPVSSAPTTNSLAALSWPVVSATGVTSASPTFPVGASSNYASQASFGQRVITDAEKYLGVPYLWGGTSPKTGFDCSGFTQHVFSDLGVSIPRTAAEQSQIGTPVQSLSQAQPGDLVFYGSPAYHVGIYIGNDQMIDAPTTGQTVSITNVGTPTSIVQVQAPSNLETSGNTSNSTVVNEPTSLGATFAAATNIYGLPQGMLQAVAQVESNFNPNAVSNAGAQGLMQIMPQTASSIGVNPMDPTQAIYGAAYLLAQKLQNFGSVPLALAAYNAGDGAVQSYGGIPPYPQTQNYVKSVMSIMQGSS